MPITFLLDAPRRRIRTTVEGRVTVDDVAAHFESLVRDQHVGYADLIDARNAKGPGWFSADVRRAAELVRNAGGGGAVGPRAILVSSSAAFGMVRMLSVLLNPWMPLEVFRDPASAEEWLDLVSPPG
ncbi:MAG TPA: hypothetical protein VMT25_05385 [Thermoanaerobaculia bacterium]|nr:hypothetical protein [Thermoanaerobaculia bacterium]